MYKIISAILFFFSIFFNNTLAQEKIVFIDINYIFKNSIVGKDLNEKIKKKDNQIGNEIKKFKVDIEKEKNEIISQKNVVSVEEYNIKISNLEKKIKDMNITIANKKKELEIYKKKVERSFSKKLNLIIEEYSTENSVDMIFDKSNILMARKELNITEKIISLFDNQIKEINIK